jgi:cysteinyl-tRNA synthetase
VAEPQQVLGVCSTVSEDKWKQKVERARTAEAGAGGNADDRGMVEVRQPEHAPRVHWRTELQEVPAGVGQLRIRRVERVDGGCAGKQHELRFEARRFPIRACDSFPCTGDLSDREDLGAVPTQLRGDGGAEQVAGLRLEPLRGDDESPERAEQKQLDDRTLLAGDPLGLLDEAPGHRHRRDLAPGDFLALSHRLAVHEREHRYVAEGVDRVDQLRSHTHEAAPSRDQPGLALDGSSSFEVRRQERCREPSGGDVLVEVAFFQLDDMNLASVTNEVEVLGREHGAFAQVGTEVVDQYASFYVLDAGAPALQPVSSHYCNDRFDPMTTVRLYNTLSRQKEELRPPEQEAIRIYSCGPTVYRYVHIGNLRTFMLPDLLRRSLEYLGYRTEQVMNITDVGHLTDDTFDRGEDKMLVSARLESKSPEEIAAYYTKAFMDDAAIVNIRPADHNPRATQYIPQMIQIIEALIAKGHAYEVDGTVYYDIASFPAYGRLSRNRTEALLAGVRGEVDPRKRHPGDFTLWKAAGEHRLQVWPSPWGPGFPGWHIECSAMSMSLLGERFDVHTGGADNVFPHHEAELAQSEGVTGHRVVSHWMHGGLLLLAGSRMAKSAGNFFRITELIDQGFDPLAFRYLAMQAKYRTKLNFSAEGLAGADRALRSLRERMAEWTASDGTSSGTPESNAFEARFRAAIADDLDLPAAMALVSEVVRSGLPGPHKGLLLRRWDRVLGLDLDRTTPSLDLPAAAPELLEARQKARAAKNFKESDRLRDQLAEMGVVVTDTANGQHWKVTTKPRQ